MPFDEISALADLMKRQKDREQAEMDKGRSGSTPSAGGRTSKTPSTRKR